MPISTYLHGGEYFRREISPAYEKLGLVLLAIILLSTYIGPHPLTDLRGVPEAQNQVEGSIANQIIGGITGILGLIAVFTNRNELRQVFRKHSIFLLLLAWCAITVIWALNTDVSVRRLIRLYATVFAAAGIAFTVPSLSSIHRAIVIISGVAMLMNWGSVILFPDLARDELGMYKGLYTQKNIAGIIAATAVIAWFTGARRALTFNRRIFYYIGSVLWFVFLILTGSKTSLFFTILVLSVFAFWIFFEKHAGFHFRQPLMATIAALGLGAIIVVFGAESGAFQISIDWTFTGRDVLWEHMLRLIGENPWFGSGYGSVWGLGDVSPIARWTDNSWAREAGQAHNGYLDILAALGIPGLVLFLLVLFKTLIAGVGFYRRNAASPGNEAAIEFFLIIGAFVPLHNLMETSFLRPGDSLWFFFLLIYFLISRDTLASYVMGYSANTHQKAVQKATPGDEIRGA